MRHPTCAYALNMTYNTLKMDSGLLRAEWDIQRPNTKSEYALDISFRSQSRIKLKCIVRMLSVSACWISHPGLNRKTSLSLRY